MMGRMIEDLAEADRPAVTDLCRGALDLPEDAAEAEAIVARLWAAEQPADRRTVAVAARGSADGAADALLGVAFGSLAPAADGAPRTGHVDLVAVRPGLRRRGVGRALLGAVEAALAGHGAVEVLLAGNPPFYAWPGVDVRYTPAVCAALALGYKHDRTAWNMTVDLSTPDSPALRDTGPALERLATLGIQVRRATGADLPALLTLARAQYPHWTGELADSVDRPGAGCHLALRDGEVLGFASYGSCRPSWFGPMGTVTAAQGLGIGAVLLRRCLRDQAAAGYASAQIGWVGPVPFYSGVAGARIERVFFLFRKALSREVLQGHPAPSRSA